MLKGWILKAWSALIGIMLLACVISPPALAMEALDDATLSEQTGQAAYFTNYQAPSGSGTGANVTDFGFYTVGFQAQLALNLNVKSLQLGCGGVNGAGGCDINGQNVSFGCAADSSGTCITSSSSTTPTQLKDFNMTNPFIQLAIKNPGTLSTRQIVGFRLGAGQVSGPLSFGNLISFSGYLTGSTNLQMLGQTNTALTSTTDYSPVGSATPRYDYNLGLSDWCLVRVLFCVANADQYQVSFGGQSASYGVSASGTRLTQAQIMNTNLASVVDGVANSAQCVRTTSLFGCGLSNVVLGIIAGNVADQIKGQLRQGLCNNTCDLSNYNIPYNLSNVHQIDVNSNLFGLSFQNQAIRYPGYAGAVNRGWAMYLPDAFTLNISQPMSVFVNNILSGSAAAGNIVGLPAPYLNCLGTLKFC